MSAQVRLTSKPIPPEILAQLEPEEAALTGEVSERADTHSIIVTDGDKLIAYSVFGPDEGELVAIYCARVCVPGIGPMMLKAHLGASRIAGTPMRVHIKKVGSLAAMGRAMGAQMVIDAEDADGLPQGVFT